MFICILGNFAAFRYCSRGHLESAEKSWVYIPRRTREYFCIPGAQSWHTQEPDCVFEQTLHLQPE